MERLEGAWEAVLAPCAPGAPRGARTRPRAHNGAPVLTQDLPAPVGVRLVRIDPLELLSGHAAPHGDGARARSASLARVRAPVKWRRRRQLLSRLVSVSGGDAGGGGASDHAPAGVATPLPRQPANRRGVMGGARVPGLRTLPAARGAWEKVKREGKVCGWIRLPL